MLRVAFNLNKLKIGGDEVALKLINTQFIRWRKPRWIPIAKSKIFKVPPRRVTPEEENLELMRLYNNYRTQIKSIRRHLTYKHSTSFMASADPEEQKILFQKDFARCLEINNKWNEEQKILREQRVAEELEANLEFARKRLETELLKQDKLTREVEEIVAKEKELSKDYITAENIDAAIAYALANPVDYNFAITKTGEKLVGRESNEDMKQKANVKQ